MYVTIGCHPRNASDFDRFRGGPDAYVAALKAFLLDPANNKKIVAIGECGLGKTLSFAQTLLRWIKKKKCRSIS